MTYEEAQAIAKIITSTDGWIYNVGIFCFLLNEEFPEFKWEYSVTSDGIQVTKK